MNTNAVQSLDYSPLADTPATAHKLVITRSLSLTSFIIIGCILFIASLPALIAHLWWFWILGLCAIAWTYGFAIPGIYAFIIPTEKMKAFAKQNNLRYLSSYGRLPGVIFGQSPAFPARDVVLINAHSELLVGIQDDVVMNKRNIQRGFVAQRLPGHLPRMILHSQRLKTLHGTTDIEIVDDWLFLYSSHPFTTPARMQHTLDLATSLRPKLERAAARYRDARLGDADLAMIAPQGRIISGRKRLGFTFFYVVVIILLLLLALFINQYSGPFSDILHRRL